MKVKQLIRELKQMPQNLEVHIAEHDNAEYESSGHATSLHHFRKDDFDEGDFPGKSDRMMFNDMPEECVVIHG